MRLAVILVSVVVALTLFGVGVWYWRDNNNDSAIDHKRLELLRGKEQELLASRKNAITDERIVRSFSAFEVTNYLEASSDGKWLAGSAIDLFVWDLETGRLKWTFKDKEQVGAFAISPDSELIAATYGSTVLLWSLKTGKIHSKLDDGGGIFFRLVFSPEGRHLVAVGMHAGPRIWQIPTGQVGQFVDPDWNRTNTAAGFGPGGKSLILSHEAEFGGGIAEFDVSTGRKLRELGNPGEGGWIVVSPDGRFLAQTSIRGLPETIRLIDLRRGDVRTLQCFPVPAQSLSYSPDSKLLLFAGSTPGGTKIWEVDSGKELRSFSPAEFDIGSPAIFSAGGSLLYALQRPPRGNTRLNTYSAREVLDDHAFQRVLMAKRASAQLLEEVRRWASLEQKWDEWLEVSSLDGRATDERLAQLKGLPKVTVLRMFSAKQITVAGLNVIKHLSNLRELDVSFSPVVTDEFLAQVEFPSSLRNLSLNDTKVTEANSSGHPRPELTRHLVF